MYSEKFLKALKLLTSPSCNVADFLYSKNTQREIGHSNSTPRTPQGHSMGTLMPLGHSGTQETRALGALGALGHSKSTWTLGHSRHLTIAVGDSKFTISCFSETK